MEYEEQAQIIENNIKAAIKKSRKAGVISISIDNLMQVTPTKGVNVPPVIYRPMFVAAARRVSKARGFVVYGFTK